MIISLYIYILALNAHEYMCVVSYHLSKWYQPNRSNLAPPPPPLSYLRALLRFLETTPLHRYAAAAYLRSRATQPIASAIATAAAAAYVLSLPLHAAAASLRNLRSISLTAATDRYYRR